MTTRAEYEARREAVAARMTADPRLFDMRNYARETDCGTVCCIAGHTLLEMGARFHFFFGASEAITFSNGEKSGNALKWAETATDYLGLPEFDIENHESSLFYRFDLQSPEDAALALKTAPYREE